ncbi:NifX-associated nitrogen fixation protein [Magnetospirillum aberrantis]|uniref:NifX-associated nitrogen fixation protein n=1 Tax=Magnetospirillum aberrantis SpK TaxID=908842 RepID=A0A7C9UXF3_9PROT|nr:NifX-associated nitrogen fixation protein [Magnetospirillum aberrantis]NFV79135.1 NifX-associated nitrogen fixation protein [Magnetospirillum aberrantis SpK]
MNTLVLDDADREALKRPFIQALLTLIRAQDRSGAMEADTDEELLAPFVVTKVQKRDIPMFGDPDPDILGRVEQIYMAICWLIERETGIAAAPIMNIHHEGWGRIVIITGRLIAVNAYVRELHRFGYENLVQMETKALKLVEEGIAAIRQFPDVAAA